MKDLRLFWGPKARRLYLSLPYDGKRYNELRVYDDDSVPGLQLERFSSDGLLIGMTILTTATDLTLEIQGLDTGGALP